LNGYKAALEKHNIPFNPEYLKHCNHGGMIQHEVEATIQELLNLQEKPEAIFVTSDRLTTNCLYILKKLGLRVPEDIAIAGFTNSDVAELFDPPLTVVRQPAFQIGQIATEMLINLIESKRPVTEFVTEILETQLIARGSTRRAIKDKVKS